MNKYETIVLAKPDVGDAELEQLKDKILARLVESKGIEILSQNWGKRRLAYEINDNMKGIYMYFRFLAEGKAVFELERMMKITDGIMRYMTVRLDTLVDADSFDFEEDKDNIFPFAVKKERPKKKEEETEAKEQVEDKEEAPAVEEKAEKTEKVEEKAETPAEPAVEAPAEGETAQEKEAE